MKKKDDSIYTIISGNRIRKLTESVRKLRAGLKRNIIY